MRRVNKISSLLAALLFVSGEVLAAGLGKLTVSSTLGQPLKAEIELLSVSPEDMGSVEAKLASYDAYRQAHIERTGTLSDLHMSVEKRANGQPVVRITSSSPVNDPFVDLLVELNWSSGRILREYTILLDPAPAQKPTAAAPVAPVAGSAAPATGPVAAPAMAKPAPSAKSAAAANGSNGGVRTYGPVKAGETLRSIAGKVLPANVSLEMMMASLYHANPKAFASNNMNLLKKGQVLKVPDRDSAMLMYSPHQARQLIEQQTEAWHAMQNRVADQAAQAKPGQGKETAESGKIVPAQPQEKAPAASTSQDVLKLSKGEPFKSAADANKRIQALQEDLATKNQELQDAQSRVSQLEKTVQDMQHLMDLKAKQGAQAPAEGAGPAAAPAQPVPPAAKPTVKPPVAPPPVEEPSFFGSLLANPLYIAGALGALVVAGLLWVFMVGSRRRKGLSSFEQSIMTGGDQFKTSIFKTGGAGAATERTAVTQSGATTDFSRLGLGSIDTHEVDPIAEAEVYMAYGRDAQAEEILKEALTKEPQRHEIMLKLLEIYASRQDAASFETQASELYASLGDPAGSMWQKAAEMGRSIDPNNPLYRVYGEVPDLPTVAPVVPEEEHPEVAGPSTAAHEFSAESAEPLALTAEESKAEEVAAPESDSHVMQFEMPEQVEAAPIEEAPESLPKTDLGDITLDFEPEDMAQISSFRPEEPEHAEFPAFGTALEHGLEPMEEIQIPAPEEAELPEEPQALEPAVELGDLGLMAEHPAEMVEAEAFERPKTKPEEGVVELPDLDFSGIDLELNEAAEARVEPAEAAPSAGIEAPSSIDPDLFEEVNTKLDLAKAYLEMGDKEGAREILSEVLKEGDAQQQQQANDLMAEIG